MGRFEKAIALARESLKTANENQTSELSKIIGESYFNLNDFYVGFGIGLEDTGFDYTASFNVGFRPYFKKVLIEKGENLFYQYHEKTFLISIDLEKR